MPFSALVNETLEDFWVRLSPIRISGWSMARCRKVLGLDRFVAEDAHDAGVDCRLCHFMLEELRRGVEFPMPGRG